MTIKFKRLDHIQICIPAGAEAEQTARAFYCDLLGLEEIEKPEYLKPNDGFWLNIANIQLHIGMEDVQHNSKRHPAFVIDDLDQAKAYLQAHGVRTKDDPPIPGFKRFSFFDPFDNRIELLESI